MKKEYVSPEVDIEKFNINSLITTSGFEDVDTEEDW